MVDVENPAMEACAQPEEPENGLEPGISSIVFKAATTPTFSSSVVPAHYHVCCVYVQLMRSLRFWTREREGDHREQPAGLPPSRRREGRHSGGQQRGPRHRGRRGKVRR